MRILTVKRGELKQAGRDELKKPETGGTARTLVVLLGSLMAAIGLELFLLPNQLIAGGVAGVSILFSHMTEMRLGLFLFLLNLPFVFWGAASLVRAFSALAASGLLLFSVTALLLHSVPPLVVHPLLASVLGGTLMGTGIGIVIRYGGYLDGTIGVPRRPDGTPLRSGRWMMLFNCAVLLLAGFLFGVDQALYSIIAYYLAYRCVQAAANGFVRTKTIWVISDKYDMLVQVLSARLQRRPTILRGSDAATGEPLQVIVCIVARREERLVRELVTGADRQAWIGAAPKYGSRGRIPR
ncbi:YitT family protein [Paenibacillus sabuli]|nr:YitT family protein [Paenibacillus sabuli]